MNLGITVLGSGSRGNSVLIHTTDTGILVDAGFSRKEILARFAASGLDAGIVKALLITHDHGDHVRGARVLADHLKIPTYVNEKTYKKMHSRNEIGKQVNIFEAGSDFDIDIFKIHPFAVPHDAMEPVGFTVTVAGASGSSHKIGIATDLGHVNNLVKARMQDCSALILECNHDRHMLRNSDRDISLKQRIGSRFGHLNNDDALAALEELLHEKTRHLFLYHLSDECNCPKLVAESASAKLAEIGRTDINLLVTRQDCPLETVWI